MNLINSFSYAFIFSILLSFVMLHFLKQKNWLIDKVNTSSHKRLTSIFSSSKTVLCGGIIIFICSVVFLDHELYVLKILGGCMLIVGILSDTNKFNSPKFRFIIQFLIVLLLLVLNQNLAITDLRINFIRDILEIKFFSILFTIFCILILINGSNFLDGVNTLILGYYILVMGVIITTSIQFNLNLNPNIFYLLIFLCTVYMFNFFNKIYLGDAGSYLISFFTAFFILDFFSMNLTVSPYFICLLLWYPAFENLFSILRRVFFKSDLAKADQGHLHQLIYQFFAHNKFFDRKYLNTMTGTLINLFIFLICAIFYNYYSFTKFLVLAIFLNIIIYMFLYFIIKKKLNHFK